MASEARNDEPVQVAANTNELVHETMTVEEAAAFLRVNVKTIYDAIRNGEAPWAKKLGRIVRINRAALIRWFDSDNNQGDTRRDRVRRKGR